MGQGIHVLMELTYSSKTRSTLVSVGIEIRPGLACDGCMWAVCYGRGGKLAQCGSPEAGFWLFLPGQRWTRLECSVGEGKPLACPSRKRRDPVAAGSRAGQRACAGLMRFWEVP